MLGFWTPGLRNSEVEMVCFLLVQCTCLNCFFLWSGVTLLSADSSGGRVLSRLRVLLRGQQGTAPFWWCIETTDQHPVRRIFTCTFYGKYTRWEQPLCVRLAWFMPEYYSNLYLSAPASRKANSVSSCITLEDLIPSILLCIYPTTSLSCIKWSSLEPKSNQITPQQSTFALLL